jgi:hypothetical protein
MLVVDFMHEFELGVWKAIFTHLIRILVAHGGDAVQSLNTRFVQLHLSSQIYCVHGRHRYRQVPTFGNAVIRRFSNNASAMKKLAARNFEDLLQVRTQPLALLFLAYQLCSVLCRYLRAFSMKSTTV